MKKFRQFIKESKTYPLGVPTHFTHSENRKVSLKEDGSALPHKMGAIDKHLESRPANPHLEIKPNDNYDGTLKHMRKADSVEEHLEKHYDYDSVPHHKEITKYTQGSGLINRGLYHASTVEGVSHDNMPEKLAHHNIGKIDAAVNHHTLKHDLTVFSGVTSRVPADAAKHPDRLLHHPGYVSSSLSAHTAAGFTKIDNEGNHHILRIHLKAGHKMLPILKRSDYPNEQEVVLPRGHTFKLADKPETHEINSGWGDTKPHKIHIWDAHIHKEARPHEDDGRQKSLAHWANEK